MKHLKIAAIETHVADARTCCLNPATSTHRQMTDEQLGNVHEYTSDEFEEPNHEAEALNAVIRLSRKYGKNKDKVR